jgi:hypothetical protein
MRPNRTSSFTLLGNGRKKGSDLVWKVNLILGLVGSYLRDLCKGRNKSVSKIIDPE